MNTASPRHALLPARRAPSAKPASPWITTSAALVAALALLPLAFIVGITVQTGWAEVVAMVVRPRVAELLANTVLLVALTVPLCALLAVALAWLTERSDVLPWSLLTAVKTKTEKNRILPVFGPNLMALNQKSQRVQGFMMPLDPGEKQKHFLISSVPLSCSFCLPGGPESLVEVRTQTAVKYSLEPVVVEGKFSVLADDPYGMYYRMSDAVAVK